MKIIRWILILIFFIEGVTKLLHLPFQVNFFNHWGYPMWFMYLIGAFEVLGAVGLYMSRTKLYANVGLLLLMVGALYTHIKNDPIQNMGLALVTTALLGIHLYKIYSNKTAQLAL